jgi:lipid A 3-O-deacylase
VPTLLAGQLKCCLMVAILLPLVCVTLSAQAPANDPIAALRAPGWNNGIFVGGSTSFANTPSAQTFLAGARIGRVLTHEVGSNTLRGSFEMALDVIPINEFWIGGNAQYAGAIDPFVAKWNFTGGKTVSPYLAAVGGVVFSSSNLPPGNTSQVNFGSGLELGAQWFRQSKNSINFAVKIYHLSNASIGTLNPGLNGAVQFMVGYTWH